MLNDKRRSLLNSALFRADNRTEQKNYFAVFTCFDFYIRFCRSFRTSFLPGGSLPAFRPRWYAHAFAVMAVTSLGDISRSDGHAIFKVQVRLQDHFSEKYSPLPYIQEVGKRAEKRRFPRLWTKPEKGRNLKRGHRYAAKTHHSGTAQRPARGRSLTLEQLSAETGISKSALGKYEADDFKDISPFSMVELAKFYGVSTDYLLGLTEQKNHPNTELDALHLGDDAIEVLKTGKFNHRLLSELICHKDFQRFLLDAEIYVDRIADMRVNDMNAVLEAVRQMALMKNGGDANDLYLRTLEVAQIREDEYFGSLIADDLKGILRDIRNEHRPDTMTADEVSLAATVQGQLQDAMNFEGSSEEKQVRSFLATFGIDYDKLTKEQFVSLIEILKLSKYLKSPINQRGKARPQLQHGKAKETQIK